MTASVDRPMPVHTQRAHYEPAWRGDRPAGIRAAARKKPGPDGIRAIDTNWQFAWKDTTNHALGGNPRCMHWATPGKNNYWFILDPGAKRARLMSRTERNRPISDWSDRNVQRWRRTRNRKSARPLTMGAMARIARSHDVYMTPELKSMAYTHDLPCQIAIGQLKRAGHPPWAMALYSRPGGKSMPGCKEKCDSWERNSGSFAVIFGRFQSYRSAFANAVTSWPRRPTRRW